MIAILRDKDLLEYVDGSTLHPVPANANAVTPTKKTAMSAWDKKDGKAQSQIELALGDAQMVHISGAKTFAEM